MRRLPPSLALCTAFCLALFLLVGQPASAGSALYAAMGGAELAAPQQGIPLNPAAGAQAARMTVQGGIRLPLQAATGLAGYLAVAESADPRRGGAVLSGVLGVAWEYVDPVFNAKQQITVYDTVTTYSYLLADDYRNWGTFGAGFRWLRSKDGVSGIESTAWRLDLGWRRRVLPQLSVGVAVRDVAGSGAVGASGRDPSWGVGASAQMGDRIMVNVDLYDLTDSSNMAWAAGVQAAVVPELMLRAGVRSAGDGQQTTFGAGYRFGAWQVDAAAYLTAGAGTSGMLGVTVAF
jgi:hypothetical protein